MLKDLLLKDWQYKLLALFMGFSLWFILNFGGKVPISLEKSVEIFNPRDGYTYRLERRKIKLKLKVMERFASEEMLEKITVGVDVGGLSEGEYVLKVEVRNMPKFIVSMEKLEPEYVKVKVIKAPNRGP